MEITNFKIKKVATQFFSDVWVLPIHPVKCRSAAILLNSAEGNLTGLFNRVKRILWYLKDVWEVDGDRNKLLINQT